MCTYGKFFDFIPKLYSAIAKLQISNEWWTAPAEAENGNTILVTGRKSLQNVRLTQKYNYRIEITWAYQGDAKGMPDFQTSKLMEQVQDALEACFDNDPVAVKQASTLATASAIGCSTRAASTFFNESSTRRSPPSPCYRSPSTQKTTPNGKNTTKCAKPK